LKIDPGKIRQLLTNLLLNALDAMPDGGKLGVSTRFEEGLQLAALEVTDTGCGIPAQVIGRIFDPFFSTKGPKGTGMGLAVSYGIVEQHGGRIEVSSQPGRGTTFTVHLPVGDEIKSGGNTL
jgi:two-component system NtrC family sensor kinase